MVDWLEFDVEFDRSCRWDWVEIFDGEDDNAKSLGRFCNSQLPSSIKSSGGSLMIHLHTDESEVGKGFSLTYSASAGEDPGKSLK